MTYALLPSGDPCFSFCIEWYIYIYIFGAFGDSSRNVKFKMFYILCLRRYEGQRFVLGEFESEMRCGRINMGIGPVLI